MVFWQRPLPNRNASGLLALHKEVANTSLCNRTMLKSQADRGPYFLRLANAGE